MTVTRPLDVELVVPVAAPPGEVFALLAELTRVPEWMSETIASVERLCTAYRYRTVSGLAGTWTWLEYAPPSHLRWSGPAVAFGPLATFQVGASFDIAETRPGHSLARGRLELRLGRALRLLAPFLTRQAHAQWTRDLGRLAALAERDARKTLRRARAAGRAGSPRAGRFPRR